MKITEAKLKQIIKEETIVSLFERSDFETAERMLWESRQEQILNEKWLQKLLGKWTPTDKDIEDLEIADQLEDAAALAAAELQKQGTYTKTQAEKIVKQYLDADPELNRVDHKDLTKIFFDLGRDAAKEIVDAESAEDAKGDPATTPADVKASEESEEIKAQSPAEAIKDLKDLIVSPAQRRMLLRGLLTLLTNDSVERALAILKPEPAKLAVLAFLKQVVDMEPKAYKRFKTGMQKDIFRDMLGSEAAFNIATSQEIDQMTDPAASEEEQERAAKAVRGQVGRAAGRATQGRLGRLGLSEGLNRELTEKIIIVEMLNLLLEREQSK